jgi:pimeloyl-ACP methyl ester carboxylesterase
MTTFALVHGHFHRGSSWSHMVEALEARGQRAVAMDLPCERRDAGAAANAEAVLAAVGDAPGDELVLVGHSAGGLTIPLVAVQRPVRALVFLAAVLPDPGRSAEQQFGDEPGMILPGFDYVEGPDGLLRVPDDVAERVFYHDVPEPMARAARAELRGQTPATLEEQTPLRAWPAVPMRYVACLGDRLLAPEWQMTAPRRRLGIEPVPIQSGHCAGLAHPDELADVLVAIA